MQQGKEEIPLNKTEENNMKDFLFMFIPLLTTPEEDGKSLLEELWDYFVQNYFEADEIYPNLGIGDGSGIPLISLVFGLFFGIIVASVLVVYDKRVTGGLVRNILYSGAVGKDNAKTLDELDLGRRSQAAKSLRRSAYLKKIVSCVEEDAFYAELAEKNAEYDKKRAEDPSMPKFKYADYVFSGEEHYYIPEDKKYTAETKYSKSGTEWWSIPVAILVALVLSFVLMLALPYLLTLLDQVIGAMKSV